MDTISADTRRRIAGHIANLGSDDPAVAERAEAYLLRFGEKAVEQLTTACASPDPQVRFRSAWILGKSRDARALSILQHMTGDADGRVRYDAALALGELGNTQAVPLLQQLTTQSEDGASVHSAALMALAKLGG